MEAEPSDGAAPRSAGCLSRWFTSLQSRGLEMGGAMGMCPSCLPGPSFFPSRLQAP